MSLISNIYGTSVVEGMSINLGKISLTFFRSTIFGTHLVLESPTGLRCSATTKGTLESGEISKLVAELTSNQPVCKAAVGKLT